MPCCSAQYRVVPLPQSGSRTVRCSFPSWDEAESALIAALADLRALTPTPADVTGLSKREKKRFAALFQRFDRLLTQLRSFTVFDGRNIEDYGITQAEYEDYKAHYLNVIEELRGDRDDGGEGDGGETPLNMDYEPLAYDSVKIDYEYIIGLIQDVVSSDDEEEDFASKVMEIRG